VEKKPGGFHLSLERSLRASPRGGLCGLGKRSVLNHWRIQAREVIQRTLKLARREMMLTCELTGVDKVCEIGERYTGIGYLQPLSQWHQFGEPFEHLSECEQGLHEVFQAEMKDNEGKPQNEQYHTRDLARCIATRGSRKNRL
jgi:hypothetical protein